MKNRPIAFGHAARAQAALRLAMLALFLLVLLGLSSCTSLAYVTQAAAGQDDLNRRAQDIDVLLRDGRVDGRTGRLLSHVSDIKAFGERHALLATGNYRKYVRIDRPAVVWVVSASEPLQFRSKSWHFPLVGSFTYLGWFKLDEAKSFARGLEREGWDVDVRGAGAYSTAGFFEDAVLSTMMPRGREALGELANTILHESAHATFFVRNQSILNESVANFVGDALAKEYLAGAPDAKSEETAAYIAQEDSNERRGQAMQAAYLALESLYSSPKPDAEKLAEKRLIVQRLVTQLGARRPITNATLIQFKTYNSGQEDLAVLLRACGGDWQKFIKTLKQLETAKLPIVQNADVGSMVRTLMP